MNVMTNCSSFRSGYLCLPRFVGAGLHCHLQRHPRHMAALLPLVREPLEARVIDGGREVEQQDVTVVLPAAARARPRPWLAAARCAACGAALSAAAACCCL